MPCYGVYALTYLFTVDRQRRSVDLLVNGARVQEGEGPLWTDIVDIDDFAPVIQAYSTQHDDLPFDVMCC
jgi:hypothetical protein